MQNPELFYNRQTEKIDCFSADGISSHWNTLFEAIGCFSLFCPRIEVRPSLTEEDIQRGSQKREPVLLRQGYKQEKGSTIIEKSGCAWRILYKTSSNNKQLIPGSFLYKPSFTEYQLLEEMKQGNLFDYFQSDIEFPEILRSNFANFPPIFKNSLVSKIDISELSKSYAEEEG